MVTTQISAHPTPSSLHPPLGRRLNRSGLQLLWRRCPRERCPTFPRHMAATRFPHHSQTKTTWLMLATPRTAKPTSLTKLAVGIPLTNTVTGSIKPEDHHAFHHNGGKPCHTPSASRQSLGTPRPRKRPKRAKIPQEGGERRDLTGRPPHLASTPLPWEHTAFL